MALDYANPLILTRMEDTRQFIANEANRSEKTDTALVGLAAYLLDTTSVAAAVLLTTDKLAGWATEVLLLNHGFDNQIEYRYASENYLKMIFAAEFREGRPAYRTVLKSTPIFSLIKHLTRALSPLSHIDM